MCVNSLTVQAHFPADLYHVSRPESENVFKVYEGNMPAGDKDVGNRMERKHVCL